MRRSPISAAPPSWSAKRIAVATNNDSAYPVAEALAEAGAEVEIVDCARRRAGDGAQSHARREIEGVDGRTASTGVRFGGADSPRRHAAPLGRLDADRPSLRAGARKTPLRRDARGARPRRRGRGRGGRGRGQRRLHARRGARGRPRGGRRRGRGAERARGLYRVTPLWPKPDAPGRRWIDFQSDVTLKDVALAAREGYVSVEHLKRYTTLGMATDQGRTSSVNGLAALAALTGRTIDETGTTTYRPPFVPVPMNVIGGRRRGAAHEPAEAPAARSRAPRRRRADARIRRLAAGPPGTGPDDPEHADPGARRSAPATRSRCSTARRSARSR